jgi:hypothetical protein
VIDADDEPTRDEYLTTAQLDQLRAIAGNHAATARRLTIDVARVLAVLDMPRTTNEGSDDGPEANLERG